jgi:hypothetical protein
MYMQEEFYVLYHQVTFVSFISNRIIVVGKMTMEMGDQSTIRCVTSDLICELEFKTKVLFKDIYSICLHIPIKL